MAGYLSHLAGSVTLCLRTWINAAPNDSACGIEVNHVTCQYRLKG